MAKITDLSVVQALGGDETLPMVQDGVTRRVGFRGMAASMLPFLPAAFKGDPGAAGNVAANLVQLKAAPIAADTMLWGGTPFRWETDRAPYKADEDQPYITTVKSNHQPLTVGAWVRQRAAGVSFQRSGGVPLDVEAKLSLTVDIEDFGAKGDNVTDDTAAFDKAFRELPNGALINLRAGATYVQKRSMVFSKSIALVAASREQTGIRFAADGDYLRLPSGDRAAMIFMHPSVQGITGYDGKPLTGYAGRSVLRGIGITGTPGMQAGTNGLFIAGPVYMYEMDVLAFTANGILVQAGIDTPTKGNANGTSFNNVNALGNTHSGFAFVGNDANRCPMNGTNSAQNGGYGYYIDTLLGVSLAATEADNNGRGGYFETKDRPAKTVLMAPYSETAPHFSLNNRSVMIGMQGLGQATRDIGAAYFGGNASGDAYINKRLVIAINEGIANVLGSAIDPGQAIAVSEKGIEWRMAPGQELTSLSDRDGQNYAAFYVNGMQSTLWCANAITGNLVKGRQWAVGGVAFGTKSAIIGSGSAPPSTGSYEQGAILLNDTPTAGGKIGWVCVAAGSPGTWKAYGSIDA